jgi:hypothetical protein
MVGKRSRKQPEPKLAPSAPKNDPQQDPEISLLERKPASPFCSPRWRWLRAKCAISLPAYELAELWDEKDWDDDLIDAVNYLLTQGRTDENRHSALKAFSDIGAAETLNGAPSFKRTELEARLLAGEPHADISQKTRLSLGVVKRYAALFYDVAGRRTDKSYVFATLLRQGIHQEIREDDVDSILKLFAIWGGGPMLEAGIRFMATPQPMIPKRLQVVPSAQLHEWRQWLNFRVIILSMTCNPKTDWERLKLDEAMAPHLRP